MTIRPLPAHLETLRLDPARAALLIIDVQTKLCAAMQPAAVAACQRNLLVLVELARRLRLPLVVSEQYPKGLGPTVPELAAALEAAGPQGSAPIRFEKTAFACTEQEGFEAIRERVARPQWIVAGMESHVCVWQTVRGLLAAPGTSVHVAADAVLSRDPANRQVGLELMARAGAVLSSTETVAFDTLVRAGGEDWKAISRLVR
jgi:nicotinamidase-related amidase